MAKTETPTPASPANIAQPDSFITNIFNFFCGGDVKARQELARSRLGRTLAVLASVTGVSNVSLASTVRSPLGEKLLRASRCAPPREENIYPVVSQPYINRNPKGDNRGNGPPAPPPLPDLLDGDPRCCEAATQQRWSITVLASGSELLCGHLLQTPSAS